MSKRLRLVKDERAQEALGGIIRNQGVNSRLQLAKDAQLSGCAAMAAEQAAAHTIIRKQGVNGRLQFAQKPQLSGGAATARQRAGLGKTFAMIFALLVLCVATFMAVSASYVSIAAQADSAQVAKFNVAGNTSLSKSWTFKIAPGQSSADGTLGSEYPFTLETTNNSEVSVEYKITVVNQSENLPLDFEVVRTDATLATSEGETQDVADDARDGDSATTVNGEGAVAFATIADDSTPAADSALKGLAGADDAQSGDVHSLTNISEVANTFTFTDTAEPNSAATYKLNVTWPALYNSLKYAGMVDYVVVSVSAVQVD